MNRQRKREYQQYDPYVRHLPYAREKCRAVFSVFDSFTEPVAEDLFGGREVDMLWTIFVMLLILWLLGMVSSYTLAGYIHILLLVALVVLVINLVTGRRGAI
jgi:Family of unknown function (DUF5670)